MGCKCHSSITLFEFFKEIEMTKLPLPNLKYLSRSTPARIITIINTSVKIKYLAWGASATNIYIKIQINSLGFSKSDYKYTSNIDASILCQHQIKTHGFSSMKLIPCKRSTSQKMMLMINFLPLS